MHIYESITLEIIKAIERGIVKFQMPWHGKDCLPCNPISGTRYQGVNCLLLWAIQGRCGYSSNHFATYNHWQQAGCQVRRGERGTPVIFYKKIGDEDEDNPHFALRSFVVFNQDQVEGKLEPPPPVSRSVSIEKFILQCGASIKYGGGVAAYLPKEDLVLMPQPEQFVGTKTSSPTEAFYSTLFHELVHWTGAEHRLGRDLSGRFGCESYAMEELVAEIGAAYLCSDLGVTCTPRLDHAAYLASWLRVLKSDNRAIFAASRSAREAAIYLQCRD